MFFEFHKASDLSLQGAVRPPKPDILLKKTTARLRGL